MVFDFDVNSAFGMTCHNTCKELTVRFNVGSHRPVEGDMIGIYSIEMINKSEDNLNHPLAIAPVDHKLFDKVRAVTFSRKFTLLPFEGLTSDSLAHFLVPRKKSERKKF